MNLRVRNAKPNFCVRTRILRGLNPPTKFRTGKGLSIFKISNYQKNSTRNFQNTRFSEISQGSRLQETLAPDGAVNTADQNPALWGFGRRFWVPILRPDFRPQNRCAQQSGTRPFSQTALSTPAGTNEENLAPK